MDAATLGKNPGAASCSLIAGCVFSGMNHSRAYAAANARTTATMESAATVPPPTRPAPPVTASSR